MPKRIYDAWPDYLGQVLTVITPTERLSGVLTGLAPVENVNRDGAVVEPPWVLKSEHALVLIDPDNPAVAVYTDTGRVIAPAEMPLLTDSRRIGRRGSR